MKICVIDDEFAVRSGVVFKLNSLNKRVEVFDAGYGQGALEKVRKIRPEIVITDIMMPGLDGLELLRLLKEELPAVRVYLLTGYSEFEYARKAIQLGANGYLLKPAAREDLLKLVTDVQQEKLLKAEADFRRYNARLKERGIYTDLQLHELRMPSLWDDDAQPKRIQLFTAGDAPPGNEADWILSFRLKKEVYGQVIRSSWSESGCFTTDEQFLPALTQAVEYRESELFFEDGKGCRRRGGETMLKMSASMRQVIIHAVKEQQLPQLEEELGRFLEHVRCLELKQLRKECAYLMAALDEVMTAKHDINIVEEDKLAYWTAWVTQHASWSELSFRMERFIYGGTKAIAELESASHPTVLVDKAMQLVTRSKGASISLEAVAAALSVHAVTLSRVFKQQTGENFVRYAVRHRMKQAERLLIESEKKVGEIAEEIGYADYRYFSHLFKQAYGLSPSEYRKKHDT